MQVITLIPGIEWLRRSRMLAVAAFILGLVLVLGSTPAHAAQLTVSWSDATPDDHTGFKVERKTGTNGAFAQVTTTGPTVMAYLDTTLTAGTTYCYRVRAYNTVGDSPYTAEACAVAPTPVVRTLTSAKSGTGTGTVASSPSGITCGSTCSATYTGGTTVALSATPTTGSTFTGWTGACTGTGGCTVVLDADKSATATFALGTPTTSALTVMKSGTGTGTVTSNTGGLNCGSTCSASYATGTNVTLTATPASGSTFTGWGGASCSGTGSCVVNMRAAQGVTATFAAGAPLTSPLTVSSLTANRTGTQQVGQSLTVTATATGGVAPYQYKWWVWNGSAWTLLRGWTSSPTYTWTPANAGNYHLGVWVKNGNAVGDVGAAYRSLPVTIAPATVSLAASPGGTQATGTSITATATATGVTSPKYRFWLWNGSAWRVARDWGSASFTWTPTAAGSYHLGVWVKPNSAAGAVWAAYRSLPVTIR